VSRYERFCLIRQDVRQIMSYAGEGIRG